MNNDALLAELSSKRWFGGQDRAATALKIVERATISKVPPQLEIVLATIDFAGRGRRLYQLLLVGGGGESPSDAIDDPGILKPIGNLMAHGQSLAGKRGVFHFAGPGLNPLEPPGGRSVRSIKAEQTNSSFVLDGKVIVKVFRRPEPGPNPDLELNRLLTSIGFENVPAQVGEITYEGHLDGRRQTVDLAIAQEFIHRGSDGWNRTVKGVGEILENVRDKTTGRERHDIVELEGASLFSELEQLGDVSASLHVAFSRDDLPAELSPEPARVTDLNAWARRARTSLTRAMRTQPQVVQGLVEPATALIDSFKRTPERGVKMRVHGDFHLGQVMLTRKGWMLLDFEGEPSRSLEERRAKQSPLKDVAGMLRSLNYAASTALFQKAAPDTEEWHKLEPWADAWEAIARDRFLSAYRRRSHEAHYLSSDRSALALMLSFFEFEKALYELNYEIEHRPQWVRIPLRGVRSVLRRRRRR